ncbi:MAG: hypothetical protein ACI8VY_000839, partial [Cellvibrionaceae bacterium]
MDWQKPAYMGGILVLSLAILFEWNQFKEDKALATINNDSSLVSTVNGVDSNGVSNSTIPAVPVIEDSDLPIASNESNLPTDATDVAGNTTDSISDFVSIKTSTIEM